MFIKIGTRHLNIQNISYIEQVGENYKIHMLNHENAPLTVSQADTIWTNNSGYQDMKAWLTQQVQQQGGQPDAVTGSKR